MENSLPREFGRGLEATGRDVAIRPSLVLVRNDLVDGCHPASSIEAVRRGSQFQNKGLGEVEETIARLVDDSIGVLIIETLGHGEAVTFLDRSDPL